MDNDAKLKAVLDALQVLFGDTSVSEETTAENLRAVSEEAELLLDSLG